MLSISSRDQRSLYRVPILRATETLLIIRALRRDRAREPVPRQNDVNSTVVRPQRRVGTREHDDPSDLARENPRTAKQTVLVLVLWPRRSRLCLCLCRSEADCACDCAAFAREHGDLSNYSTCEILFTPPPGLFRLALDASAVVAAPPAPAADTFLSTCLSPTPHGVIFVSAGVGAGASRWIGAL